MKLYYFDMAGCQTWEMEVCVTDTLLYYVCVTRAAMDLLWDEVFISSCTYKLSLINMICIVIHLEMRAVRPEVPGE